MDANAFWAQTVHVFWLVAGVLRALAPVAVWCVFWLWAVNWKKVWPVLVRGAWVPFVLLGLVSALAWSRIEAHPWDRLGFVTLPNFWWQLGCVATLAALALCCGWLQEILGWAPAEIEVDPPVHGHDHAGHAHH